MAVIPPSQPIPDNDPMRVEPPEHYAHDTRWGWGGFVNMWDSEAGAVVNIVNVYNVVGLGSDRQEYPTGSPSADAEEYALGRQQPTQVTVDCWRSASHPSHARIKAAHDTGEKNTFVVRLGPPDVAGNAILYRFDAQVKTWQAGAGLESAVTLRIVLRPSGKVEEI